MQCSDWSWGREGISGQGKQRSAPGSEMLEAGAQTPKYFADCVYFAVYEEQTVH